MGVYCSPILVVLHLVCFNIPKCDLTQFYLGELSDADYASVQSSPRPRAGDQLPAFKYLYLDEEGNVNETLDRSIVQLEIAGSPLCQEQALRVAANDIIKMTQYMPRSIFRNVASKSTVGVFSAQEKIIVFPEYAHYANGDCGTSCTGSCSHTCSSDGRKWENVAGIGGRRAAILEDNILCTSRDPYYHHLSVLVHEYTHTIHAYGLDPATRHNVTAAFNAARQARTWEVPSYAMSNEREYLAVATTVFFGVNRNGFHNSGGMNTCGAALCQTEQEGRMRLRERDPALFQILAKVFTEDNANLTSLLTTCPVQDVDYVVVG
ncbi:hypothetical protein Btru_002063 [Bulinus truncatus]|nr:hypothetical protein Btru_002063 [Bulinus truncatus]